MNKQELFIWFYTARAQESKLFPLYEDYWLSDKYCPKKQVPIYLLIFIVFIMLILSLFAYNGSISLLPCIACILYTISIWQSNLKVTRIVEVISCSLYIIYNIKVLAYVGLVSTMIELISALIAIYRFDIKKDYK